MSAQRLALTLAYAVSLASCKNANHCAGNPLDDCRLMWDAPPIEIDAADTCSGNIDCKAPTTVCDLSGAMKCVQCTTSDNPCPTAMPICITNQCQKCTTHTQCPASNVCLPDGSCANEAQVAYVAMGGSGTACTKATPCRTLDDGLNANKFIVKIAAGLVKDNKITTISGRTVTILADPGAKLDRDGDGPILQVQNNGTDVAIYDLEISGASGGGGADGVELIPNGGNPKLSLTRVTVSGNNDVGLLVGGGTLTMSQGTVSGNLGGGISASGGTLMVSQATVSDNPGGGISATGGTLTLSQNTVSSNTGVGVSISAGTLTLSQNTVSSNTGVGVSISAGALTLSQNTVSGNASGGLSVTGTTTSFSIENNFIIYNGVATEPGASQNGGAAILSNTAGSKFQHNTVAFNKSSGLVFRGGVSCTGPLVTAPGNLVYHNTEGDMAGGTKTDATTQLNGAGGCQYGNTLAVPTDAGNLGFNSPIVPPFNFHLTSTSPATIVDAGGSCSGVDFDADTRPVGAACDLGADEYRP